LRMRDLDSEREIDRFSVADGGLSPVAYLR
jgi:hypothetical protein